MAKKKTSQPAQTPTPKLLKAGESARYVCDDCRSLEFEVCYEPSYRGSTADHDHGFPLISITSCPFCGGDNIAVM